MPRRRAGRHNRMDNTRRTLLKWASGAGLVAASPAPLATEDRGAPALSRTDLGAIASNDWAPVQRLFTFSTRAPLNAANLCPPYRAVRETQNAYAEQLAGDVSFLARRDFLLDKVKAARQQCADMLGAGSTNCLAFVRNTTEANATVINGIPLRASDEVVLWDQNHGSNNLAWNYQRQRRPFVCRTVVLAPGVLNERAIVDSFMRAVNKNTRVVSFSHISNLSGIRIPAHGLCAEIHRYNPDIFVHIDGAQSWGSIDVDLNRIGCDSYSASGHKWLCGPRGTGILFVREPWIRRISPSIYGYDAQYDYPEDGLQNDAARFENLGQLDSAAYGALGNAVVTARQIGVPRIEQRVGALTRHALKAFSDAGIATVTPTDPAIGHGVVVVDLGSRWKTYGAFLALHNAGYAAAFVHGYHVRCTPQGTERIDDAPVRLRICPHIYNSVADIDSAVAIARKIRDSSFEIVREVVRFL